MAPDQPPDPIAVALHVASILERLDIPYFAAGAVASSLHGDLRSTNDVDLIADLRLAHIAPLHSALSADYYVSEEAMKEALRSDTSFNAIHLPTAFKVDIFVVGRDPFNLERLKHRQRMQVRAEPPALLFVDLPEHTILRKLEWYRRGGEVSERQWRDVIGVLRVRGDGLDQARLDTWAERLGVADLLAQARREAEPR